MHPLKFDIRNQDFWAALMLIGIGAGAAVVARNYPMGTTLRMGAGYFPTMLGWLLVVFGCCLLFKSRRSSARIAPSWSPRAFIVLPLALALFGLLLDRVGFVPALVALIVGAAAAGNEFRIVEVLALAAALTVSAVVVFIWGLGLPYSLFIGLPGL